MQHDSGVRDPHPRCPVCDEMMAVSGTHNTKPDHPGFVLITYQCACGHIEDMTGRRTRAVA
jgi:hypothetical protein